MEQVPKISVAMASYNGGRYILEQLRSIAAQTLCPYEIVIVDDASRDDTIQKIEEFARDSAISVRVIRKESNQGSTRSFSEAIEACAGEFIALSDQDDVWVSGKLEALFKLMEARAWDAVFSDADFVDKDLQPMGRRLLPNSGLTSAMRRDFLRGHGFAPLLKYNVATGATMMFRAKFKPLILPVADGWIHDYWIALLVSAAGTIGLSEERLILYRQHGQNQIGARRGLSAEVGSARSKPAESYLKEADVFDMARERLERCGFKDALKINELRNKARFLRARFEMRRRFLARHFYVLMSALKGHYFKYGQGFRPLMKDMFLP